MTREAIGKERCNHPARPHVVAQSSGYPLLDLHSRQFEFLTHALLSAEASDLGEYDRAALLLEGPDKARDILLYHRRKLAGIVQCKRKASALGLPEIIDELLRFCLHAARNPLLLPKSFAIRYELWTASGLREKARQFFDDETASAEKIAGLGPADLDRARRGEVSLAPPSDQDEARREIDTALRIASRLKVKHVGPDQIFPLLRGHEAIRRAFFRSPDDEPRRARDDEVGGLEDRYRRTLLEDLAEAGSAGGAPYVARPALGSAFDDFMSDDSRVFVVVGGSGQGKTTWAARLLETPPAGWSCDMVRAEEILPQDSNITATLGRLFLAGRTGTVPRTNFVESVWNWMDAANRILIIDGLDRVPSTARDHLARWLENSARSVEDVPVRLVITSRREALSALLATPPWRSRRVYGARDQSISFEFGLLEADEADALYAACGVNPTDHRGKRLRSPSLIRRYSRLRHSLDGTVVTRFDVLTADLIAIRQELASKPGVGQISVELLLERLGNCLISSSDGWVSLKQIVHAGSFLERAAEELVLADRARLLQANLRLDSDDMIELVMGHALTADEASVQVGSGRKEPLLVGGVAMMIARLEHQGHDAAGAIDRLLAGAVAGDRARLDAVCRALLEVRRPEDFLPQARKAVGLWEGDNFLMYTSLIAELIQEIALPGSERLRLMLPLAHGEDLDDWREKYWFDPARGGRMISPFVVAAESAVRSEPVKSLEIILPSLHSANEIDRAVGAFLLREAAIFAPHAALQATWTQGPALGRDAFDLVSSSVPGPAIRFLGEAGARDPQLLPDIVARIMDLTGREWLTPRPAHPSASEVLSAARVLLPLAAAPSDQALLLIASLHFEPDEEQRQRLLELWDHVPEEHYWNAFAVAECDRERLLESLLRGEDPTHDVAYIVGRISPDALAGANIEEIIRVMGEVLREDPALEEPIASAVEMLLYAIPASADPHDVLLDLALELAGSQNDGVRAKLIYYAGSPSRTSKGRGEEVERRELLLGELIDNETGGNLEQLVWKLGESADERPAALARLMRLVYMFGPDEVLGAIEPISPLPYMEALRDELLEALERSG